MLLVMFCNDVVVYFMVLLVLLLVVFFLIFLVFWVVFTLLLLVVVLLLLLFFVMLRMLVMMLVLLLVMVLVLACDRHVPDKRGRAAAPQCVSGQRGAGGGGTSRGAEILSLLQPPPACTQRAHNAKVQTILVARTEGVLNVYKATTHWSSSDSCLQTASAQIQNIARKITMYTHSHKFCVN